MATSDPRVDAYIKKAQPFAKPILTHLRSVVHEACPEVQETLKWGMPHFDYKGIFCGMAAFKQHTTFGFWKGALLKEHLPKVDEQAMWQFGRITSIDDLPNKATLSRIVKAAARINDQGLKVARVPAAKKPPLKAPAELLSALAKNKKAQANFKAFPPGQQREYITWVTEAKQDATRAKRIKTAVEWISEGKIRNWKYVR